VLFRRKLKTALLKLRIAYHRRKAGSYNEPIASRCIGPDPYVIWMRNMAMRHGIRSRELERQLRLNGVLKTGASKQPQ
jgi:hypothetical protein